MLQDFVHCKVCGNDALNEMLTIGYLEKRMICVWFHLVFKHVLFLQFVILIVS